MDRVVIGQENRAVAEVLRARSHSVHGTREDAIVNILVKEFSQQWDVKAENDWNLN